MNIVFHIKNGTKHDNVEWTSWDGPVPRIGEKIFLNHYPVPCVDRILVIKGIIHDITWLQPNLVKVDIV